MNYNASEQDIFDMPLKHYGVKGMRWGVIRSRISAGRKKKSSTEEKPKKRNRVSGEINSVKRQLSWNKSVKKRKSMSDEELRKVTERVKNENNLRRLAKRKEYLNRDKLSDKELKARVDRLQLEDNLKKNVNVATKTQREIGKAVVKASVNIIIEKSTKKNPEKVSDLVKKEVMNSLNNKNKALGSIAKMVTDTKKS